MLPILATSTLFGCAVNPATGKNELSLVSEQEAEKIGHDTAAMAVKEAGGIYEDENLQSYLQERISDIVRVSETPADEFRLRLLDSEQLNAFATPGYTMINRGILPFFNNEAELMTVLGHEIGHVTARHVQRGVTQGRMLGLILQGSMLVAGQSGMSQQGVNMIGQTGSIIGQVGLRSWSRDHELEADDLGLRYISRLCYAPSRAADAMRVLARYDLLYKNLAALTGNTSDKTVFDAILSTHPETSDRIAILDEKGKVEQSCGQKVEADRYLKMIDGLSFGRTPAEGFGGKNRFYDSEHRLTFTLPDDWFFPNTYGFPLAMHEKFPIVLNAGLSETEKNLSAKEALLVKFPGFSEPEKVSAQGLTLYTVHGFVDEKKLHKVRVFAFKPSEKSAEMVIFIFKVKAEQFSRFDKDFYQVMRSLKSLSVEQAKKIKSLKVKIYTVQYGDTVSRLVDKMAMAGPAELYFRVLNGIAPGTEVEVGQKVKLIVDPNQNMKF